MFYWGKKGRWATGPEKAPRKDRFSGGGCCAKGGGGRGWGRPDTGLRGASGPPGVLSTKNRPVFETSPRATGRAGPWAGGSKKNPPKRGFDGPNEGGAKGAHCGDWARGAAAIAKREKKTRHRFCGHDFRGALRKIENGGGFRERAGTGTIQKLQKRPWDPPGGGVFEFQTGGLAYHHPGFAAVPPKTF